METVEKVEEVATVLTDRQVRGLRAGPETGCSLAHQALSHHFKVSVGDVTEGPADVTAGEPLIGSLLPLLPGCQAAQSLRQAHLQLVV